MNDEMILKNLLTPEQNDGEIERRNEEKRSRVKDRRNPLMLLNPINSAYYRLIPANTA
jgi:hypothetical protein